MLVYLSIYIAAILEGEIYYIAMCVVAAAGKVNWLGVLVAGALGGSTGDQIWFYLLRGRIHWLDRYPWLAHAPRCRGRSRQREPDADAADQPVPSGAAHRDSGRLRLRGGAALAIFSALNLVSGFAWASAIMIVIVKVGPGALSAFGLDYWWGPAIPAVLVFVFFRWLSRPKRTRESKVRGSWDLRIYLRI